MDLSTHLQRSFEKANNEESKLVGCDDILDMKGMTGIMTRHFYNNLLSAENMRYLEVGTWMGSSTFSAMYKNKATIVCIDNWAEFNEEFGNVKEIFLSNLDKYKGENSVCFIENDCFKVDVAALPKFNVYLYDGSHEEEHHHMALSYFYECLEDEFIYVCDDWDWARVRQGTYRAIQDLGLEVVSFVEMSLNEGDSWKPMGYARGTWWNGMWAAVLRKKKSAQ